MYKCINAPKYTYYYLYSCSKFLTEEDINYFYSIYIKRKKTKLSDFIRGHFDNDDFHNDFFDEEYDIMHSSLVLNNEDDIYISCIHINNKKIYEIFKDEKSALIHYIKNCKLFIETDDINKFVDPFKNVFTTNKIEYQYLLIDKYKCDIILQGIDNDSIKSFIDTLRSLNIYETHYEIIRSCKFEKVKYLNI